MCALTASRTEPAKSKAHPRERAANYTPEEIQTLTESVRARVNELVNLPPSSPAVGRLGTEGRRQ